MGNKSAIMNEYDNHHSQYHDFASKIEQLLRVFLEEERIVYNAITFRLKERESLSDKIDRKNDKYTALGELTDIAGVRVITYYAEDVDKVAEIVEREFAIDKENSIDKRDALEPDRFGYCSVHYVVEMGRERLNLREYQPYEGLKCEIQIRSVLQHAWAEIEHDLGYKSAIGLPKKIRRNFSQLAGLLEVADKEFQEIRSFLQNYQNNATENVASEEFQDSEIDAVLLKAMIESNLYIKELNETIGRYFDSPFSPVIPTGIFEDTIDKLHWFNVNTVSQLNHFIESNKDIAEKIAKEYGHDYVTRDKPEKNPLLKSIALFYICYAELIKRNADYDQILQYFQETHIVPRDNMDASVRRLLQVSEKINTQP